MYSGVARTTSPFSVVEVVYVSKGGALNPSGLRPNASRSSRSFRFSRLCVGVGVPLGGSGAPVNREHPLGLYVALPCLSTSAPVSEIGKEVTQHAPPSRFLPDWGCTGCRLGPVPIHMYGQGRLSIDRDGLCWNQPRQVRRSHVWTSVTLL